VYFSAVSLGQILTPIIGLAIVAVAYFLSRRMNRGAEARGAGSIGGPAIEALVASAKRSDFSGLAAHLAPCRDGRWDERGMTVEVVSEAMNRAALDTWCASQPNAPEPFLLRGRHGIFWAWEARGSGAASSVSKEGWRLFEERLGIAQQDLERVTQMDPADPTPWAFLVTIARARDLGRDAAQRYLDEAVRRDPESFFANNNMLSFLAAKWHGSHEEQLAFARGVAAGARPGSDLIALVIRAHVEIWAYKLHFDGDKAAADAYVRSEANRAECASAYQASLVAPGHVPRASTIYLLNEAAFWFWRAGDRARAAPAFMRIGSYAYTEYPWRYLGEPQQKYYEAASWATR
jgi:hypothetical protein